MVLNESQRIAIIIGKNPSRGNKLGQNRHDCKQIIGRVVNRKLVKNRPRVMVDEFFVFQRLQFSDGILSVSVQTNQESASRVRRRLSPERGSVNFFRVCVPGKVPLQTM